PTTRSPTRRAAGRRAATSTTSTATSWRGSTPASPSSTRGTATAADAAMTARTHGRPTILFVAGWGRSGSTLLGRMLGELPDTTCAGEMWNVWDLGFHRNLLCGCGAHFRECPFWTAVADRAYGGLDVIEGKPFTKQLRAAARMRTIPRLLRAADRGVREVAGGRVIVDVSKNPQLAFLLRLLPDFDVVVLHLVRDSRAVSYSWLREVRRPEVTHRASYIPRYRPSRSAAMWMLGNGASEVLRRASEQPLFVRYEDLVAHPRATLETIAARIGTTVPDALFPAEGTVALGPQHLAAGNPMRFDRGEVELKADEEWRDHRTPVAVTALTAPLLLRYGYPLR